ncbi:MAG: hypothetical protein DIU65_06885 [Proteobacteria bacterium]|jgi:hypothetical protein|nr:MAG: hypothetical protein DIU65_06885 [Pseudomonadota bacterium]
MKTLLVFAAVFGLSVSAASADCAWHSKVTASVDTQTTTASVTEADAQTVAEAETLKKEIPPKAE